MFQALAHYGLLGKIGYLSTVSGGGYFGGFLGMLFCNGGLPRAEHALTDDSSFEIASLRASGGFLAPRGMPDFLMSGATFLRNWVSVLIVVFALPAFATLATLDLVKDSVPLLYSTPPDYYRWWWSSWFLLPALTLLLATVPLGWAYWLVVPSSRPLYELLMTWLLPVLISVGAFLAWTNGIAEPLPMLYPGALIVTALTVTWFIVAAVGGARADTWGATIRGRLSSWLNVSLILFGIGVSLTFFDTVTQSVYLTWDREGLPGITIVSFIVVFAFVLVASWLGAGPLSRKAGVSALIISAAGMFLIRMFELMMTSGWTEGQVKLWIASVGVILTWWTSNVGGFLDESSLHSTYESRIRKAYLGAASLAPESSPIQLDGSRPAHRVPFSTYRPHDHGGPLHLINVTLNDTVGTADQRGYPMAVGPAGLSVGRRHHALWAGASGPQRTESDGRFHVFPPGQSIRPEALELGSWLAISAAAVGTGMGGGTALGTSFLMGLFNLRLGYWWDSGIPPWRSVLRTGSLGSRLGRAFGALFPVHSAFADEWLARFHGVGRRRWNLSDGGHFENLACYELIRRRLRFIVVFDNGEDGDYHYQDLSHLMRRARLDFGAEIRFLEEAELDARVDGSVRPSFGTLNQLRRGSGMVEAVKHPAADAGLDWTRRSLAHAALARIAYKDATGRKTERIGTLLYIKPTLTGSEPVDVLQYQVANPDFPHQPTTDQFFDEAQWESYRLLGEHMAGKLFMNRSRNRMWTPYLAMTEPEAAANFIELGN